MIKELYNSRSFTDKKLFNHAFDKAHETKKDQYLNFCDDETFVSDKQESENYIKFSPLFDDFITVSIQYKESFFSLESLKS